MYAVKTTNGPDLIKKTLTKCCHFNGDLFYISFSRTVVSAQLQIIPLPTNWVGHERVGNSADELLWGFFGLGFKGFGGGKYIYLLKIFYFCLGKVVSVLLYFLSPFQMPIWSLWVCESRTSS